MCHEFTFRSADRRTDIHAAEWLPQGEIRAVLQISHGVSEYIMRYAPFAAYLTARGFAVVGHDHLGHGASLPAGGTRLYFGGEGSWHTVVDDIETRRRMAAKRFPGVPYFLLGHSMGSFLARTYLIRYPGTVDGVILMGTGQMPGITLAAGKTVARLEGRRVGVKRSSPLVEKLAFGAYNQKFAPNRTAYDWLSANQENVDRYIADPLCGGSPTTGLFREMLGGMQFIEQPENLKKMDLSVPVLFTSGQDDPVGDMGKGVEKAYHAFRKAGVQDVSLKLWPGLRHEILNETEAPEVMEYLGQWLEKHL